MDAKEYIKLNCKKTGFVYSSSLFIKNSKDTISILEEIKNADREKIVAISLDEDDKILGTELVAIGSIDKCTIFNREIFKTPVLLNAKKVILAHNHPSGTSNPSKADISITKNIALAGKQLGIEFLYHIILGDEEYTVLYPQGESKRYIYEKQKQKKHKIDKVDIFIDRIDRKNQSQSIKSFQDAISIIKDILDGSGNSIVALFLDSSNKINSIQLVGNANRINYRDFSRLSIKSNSGNVILAANNKISYENIDIIKNKMLKMSVGLLDVIMAVPEKNTKEYISYREKGKFIFSETGIKEMSNEFRDNIQVSLYPNNSKIPDINIIKSMDKSGNLKKETIKAFNQTIEDKQYLYIDNKEKIKTGTILEIDKEYYKVNKPINKILFSSLERVEENTIKEMFKQEQKTKSKKNTYTNDL